MMATSTGLVISLFKLKAGADILGISFSKNGNLSLISVSQPRGALQSLGTENSENFCPAPRADEGFRCLVTAAVRVVPKCHLNELVNLFRSKQR